MYRLTLNKSERHGIDWIGHRYRHGTELYKLLCQCEWIVEPGIREDETGWDTDCNIEFVVPENVAWEISEIVAEGLDCFVPSFRDKLINFADAVV